MREISAVSIRGKPRYLLSERSLNEENTVKKNRIRAAAIAGASALSMLAVGCSGGGNETFPSGQIEVIIPWNAGGGSDQATRQLLMNAEESCGTRFVPANRTGAAGATGHDAIAGAKPDGKTVGTMTAEATILPHLDSMNTTAEDFTPVMRFAELAPAFVVPDDSPFETLSDMTDAMEAGDTVRIGTTGRGGIWDLAAGGLAEELGTDFTSRVPYEGGAPIIQALLGGHVEVGVLAAPEAVEQVNAGEFRVLAFASDERNPVLPDVPTVKEEGIEWSTGSWFGIAAPAEFPEEYVDALGDCLKEGYDSAEYQEFLEKMGFTPGYMPADEFAEFIREQDATNAELIPKLY